jgi:type I protein arginine methyltransferase
MTISSVDLAINNDIVSLQDNGDGRQHLRRQTQSSCMPKPLTGALRLRAIHPCPGDGAYMMQLDDNEGMSITLLVRPESERGMEALASVQRARHPGSSDEFSRRTDSNSSSLYFYYYGMLQHQQNMLQDHVRTGAYYAALTENASDFQGKAVMDVGCGSGILSFFAAQAGARVVYAVEASEFARYAERLVKTNPVLGSRIKVIKGKVEEITLPEKVDVLVSEPMGTLLVNERMLETYIYARKHHLVPGGKLFPTNGTIYMTAFSDTALWNEVSNKSSFWTHDNFYGVDLGALTEEARMSSFAQPVIDQIPPHVLVSNSVVQTFDFQTLDESDLLDFEIKLSLQVSRPCTVHGIAAWFDVGFVGTSCTRTLSTSPGNPLTHWYQMRVVLSEPITVTMGGETITGTMRFKAHDRQSYDLILDIGRSQEVYDLKEPYYRQLVHSYDPSLLDGMAGGVGGFGGDAVTAPMCSGVNATRASPGEETWWV